jgi:phenylacetate-CoA ligase
LPLVLWSVVKEMPGVLRFQAIQTAPDKIKYRPEAKQAADNESTWELVYANASAYFASQGLGNVEIVRAAEVPMRNPKGGKFRNIWQENHLAT